MQEKKIRTIGHSNQHIIDFLDMLKTYNITHILDVRSSPYSEYSPQFNKDELKDRLKEIWVQYMSFWKEFGARHDDIQLLNEHGQVDFEKVTKSVNFLMWVERLNKWTDSGHKLCLMCSEANPLECHRFSMLSAYLSHEQKYTISHIIREDTIIKDITQEDLEEKMLDEFKLKVGFFETKEDLIKIAYKKKNLQIWYKPSF